MAPKQQPTSMPPQQPPTKPKLPYEYEAIKPGFKHVFEINSDEEYTRDSYLQTISFIRTIACIDGAKFGKIGNLTEEDGDPLMQIDIRFKHMSVKVLIRRKDLYVVGFYISPTQKYHYTGFPIRGFEDASHNGDYSGTTLAKFDIGPNKLIESMYILHSSETGKRKAKIAETFFIHFSEAARLNLVKNLVKKTFKRGSAEFEKKEDEQNIIFRGNDGSLIDNDVGQHTREKYQIDRHKDIAELDMSVPVVVQNYMKLCKSYYTYFLTDGKTSFLDVETIRACRVADSKSLRSIIGVLPNMKYDEYEGELKKKSLDRTVPEYQEEDHSKLVAKLEVLRNSKKAFTAKRDKNQK